MAHLLEQLSLPDRYEALKRLGSDVAQILVPPKQSMSDALEKVSLSINSRSEGLFIPLSGQSGVGKSTLGTFLTHFLPSIYLPTCTHEGSISYDALMQNIQSAIKDLRNSDTRILPILLDHRESAPPTDIELAEIKRFLRNSQVRTRSLILWPETDADLAKTIAERYRGIAGPTPIEIPLVVQGPPEEQWVEIAINTLRIANNLDSLESLGVDPRNYQTSEYDTIGDFLRRISTDFNDQVFQMRKETRQPLFLTVVFPCTSQEPGVLTQLTSGNRYGLVDGHALVGVTPKSELGKWWAERRGLLTRAIVQLDAHAIHLPPTAAISILNRHGNPELQKAFSTLGISKVGPNKLFTDLDRSDFGKHIAGLEINAYETRGTPADTSTSAFDLVGEQGFVYGKDKILNRSLGVAIEEYLRHKQLDFLKITVEKQLEFCSLIPDNAIYTKHGVYCLEYTWRKGDFLSVTNRSEVAQYILKKLRDYARQLGWTND